MKKIADLWNEYIDRYHYVDYEHPIGSHLRYFIFGVKVGLSIIFLRITYFARQRPADRLVYHGT